MNKKLLLSLLVAVPAAMRADAPSYEPSDVKQITYRVTISRDDTYDQESWNKLVTDASSAIKRGNELESDTEATNAVVDAFVKGIEEIYKRNARAEDGIHGSMSIEISDALDAEIVDAQVNKSDCICSEKRAEMGSCDPECKAACAQTKGSCCGAGK